jgi:hypothetical protein
VFTLDKSGAAEILKAIAAEEVSAVAVQVAAAAGQGATVSTKVGATRFVATVQVPAEAQAKNGVLSRAASSLGLRVYPYKGGKSTGRQKVIGFVSKRQWRWAFWSQQPWARGKANDTPGEKLIRYRQLPEATGRNSK